MAEGFEDRRFDAGAVAHDAAVGPLHPGITRRQVGLAENDEAALEAALSRKPLHQGLGIVEEAVMDPHDEVGDAAQVLQGGPCRIRDGLEGLRVEGVAGDLAAQRHGEGHGLVLAFGVAGIGLSEEAGGGEPEPRDRVRKPRLRLMLGLGTTLLDAAGMGLPGGFREGGGLLRSMGSAIGTAEVGVEQEAGGVQ